MFYEKLAEARLAKLEKRASNEKYYNPSNKVLRAKRELLKMSPDDQMEALYGSTYDYGIDDEDALRRELRKRRAIGGGLVGALAGGVGGATGSASPRRSGLIGAAIGGGVGALGGAASVSRSKHPVYTDEVNRIRGLQKRLPTLSDEEKKELLDIF